MIDEKFLDKLKTVDLKNTEPSYNFLDVIRKVDNENIISDWLAFLLDAKKCGSAAPLKLLCEHIGITYNGGDISIEREYTLDNRRRIDIIVKMQNTWIVIENKINSLECNEQTIAYEEKISNEINNQAITTYYVYLKPTYNKSKPKNNKFIVITYKMLADIWESIRQDDFSRQENHVYFCEFMKLIKGKYAMNKEISFNENTKFYIEYNEQFNAVEESFNKVCQAVKEKLINDLFNNVFTKEEGWVISPHTDYIQFYKMTWGSEIHFEIGTWAWQKDCKGISFNRLIASSVEITYCLHAERGQAEKYSKQFKEIENENRLLFCTERYNFGTEDKCIASINEIVERLQVIKNSFTQTVDNIINAKI